MKTTHRIAEFIAGLKLADVPPQALAIVKGGLIDAMGVAIAGAGSTAADVVARWARDAGGAPQAGVIGGAFKTATQIAARDNGTIGQALDFDPPTPLLPVLPALLALGESQQASGRDCLEAYIAGYEVQSKLQLGVSAKHYEHGWHSNAVFGTIGATAAAAKLLKLDVDQTAMALGIAASEAGGLRQFTAERMADAHVQALAARVHITHPNGQSEWETGTRLPCKVRIICNNGAVHVAHAEAPKGDRDNPVRMHDIIVKYRECTRDFLSVQHADTVLTSIQTLESLGDIQALTDILTFGIRPKTP